MQNHQIIQNKLMSIYGLPGSGKTFFAMFLASFYPRIYSNVDFTRFGVKQNNRIEKMQDLHGIRNSDIKGIAIIDEGGLNISARRSMSDSNLEFLELGMLSRKKNIDILLISQLERSLDVVMRELCKYSFFMNAYFEQGGGLMFDVEIKGRFDHYIGEREVDLVKFANLTGWSYDTTEESRIEKTKKEVRNSAPTDEKSFSQILGFTA